MLCGVLDNKENTGSIEKSNTSPYINKSNKTLSHTGIPTKENTIIQKTYGIAKYSPNVVVISKAICL